MFCLALVEARYGPHGIPFYYFAKLNTFYIGVYSVIKIRPCSPRG